MTVHKKRSEVMFSLSDQETLLILSFNKRLERYGKFD